MDKQELTKLLVGLINRLVAHNYGIVDDLHLLHHYINHDCWDRIYTECHKCNYGTARDLLQKEVAKLNTGLKVQLETVEKV